MLLSEDDAETVIVFICYHIPARGGFTDSCKKNSGEKRKILGARGYNPRMNTIRISASQASPPKPQYPDGFYLCKDRHGFYIGMRRDGAWSWMHASFPGHSGKIASESYTSSSLVQDDIVARLEFTP